MKHTLRSLGVLAMLAMGCAAETDAGGDDAQINDLIVRGTGYFTLRHDARRCPSPMCGGWWVTPVNGDRARCADGTTQPECYVAEVDLAPAGLPVDVAAEPGVILRGAVGAGTGHRFGRFAAVEAWRPGAAVGAVDGLIERVSTEGVACAFLPCERLAERRVQSAARPRLVAGIDLSELTLDDATRDRVLGAATTDAGVILRGVRASEPGNPASVRVPVVRATQVYTRVTAPAPRVCAGDLRAVLDAATERLLQRSESDAPYTYFQRDAWRALPSNAALLRDLGLPANTAVERADLDRVLGPAAVADPGAGLGDAHRAARVRLLMETLRAQLTGVTVYRVGTVQIRVFILGRTRCGAVAGLETLAIET